MNVSRRTALGGLLAAGVAGPLRAADWPTHALNWLVPFPPGGSNDIFARPVAAHVGERLGQPLAVDNRRGAGGTTGGIGGARPPPPPFTAAGRHPRPPFSHLAHSRAALPLHAD